MKRFWKSHLATGATIALAAMTLSACGKSDKAEKKSTGKNDNANIKLWVDSSYVDTYKPIVAAFEKTHKNWKVTIKPGDSPAAQENIKKDPSAAADVFMMPHDQLGQMVDAGIIYPNTKYAESVKKNAIESAVEGATYKGKLYGYPYGVETQVLFYNKSKFSKEDVKTWEGITSKDKLGANIGSESANYVFTPLFMSNGDELYGKSGEELDGTNFDNEKGVEVLKWVHQQKQNPGVVQVNAEALSYLTSGKINAFLSGPWSKNDVKKALGANYAVAPYPTINFGQGSVQQKAFLGVKLFAVNASTKSPLAAMALADYLASEEVQTTIAEKVGIIPANKNAQASDAVQNDELAKAVMTMSDSKHSVVMPKIPEMVSFWGPSDALFIDTYNGKIKEDQYLPKLKQLVETTSKKGE